ncbi:unnamed protein product, partial [Prorocentrum cordatum]
MGEEVAEVLNSDLYDIYSDDDLYLNMGGENSADGWACWHRDEVPGNSFSAVLTLDQEAFEVERACEERHSLWRLSSDVVVGVSSVSQDDVCEGAADVVDSLGFGMGGTHANKKQRSEGDDGIFEEKPAALVADSYVDAEMDHGPNPMEDKQEDGVQEEIEKPSSLFVEFEGGDPEQDKECMDMIMAKGGDREGFLGWMQAQPECQGELM